MNVLSLTKATLVCGGASFVFYSFPIVAAWLIITVLGLLWLSCAHRALSALLRK